MASQRPILALTTPGVRVQTLVMLRWIAIFGQTLAILVVGFGFRYELPWAPVLAAVAASAALNLGLSWLYSKHDRISGRTAMFQMGFDLVQVWVLLFLTGGLLNPFALLLMVPITIAATLLPLRMTSALLVMSLGLLLILWRWHLPLPWGGADEIYLPPLFLMGVLISIGIGMLFLALFTWQVSAEARRHHAALIATQSVLDRETRMGALGSLAAAAAHELGGPLGTITLIATDLEHALGDDPDFGADIHLLRQEARRCRDILAGFAKRAEHEDPFPVQLLPVILREAVDGFETPRVPIEMRLEWPGGQAPVMRRSAELLYVLSNIISNAIRHARTRVVIEGGSDHGGHWVAVVDDGAGFDPVLLPNLGEPFLGPSFSGAGSTGLGIFIATTLLGHTGGRMHFSNRAGGGARVEMRWSEADMEKARKTLTEEGSR